MACDYTTCHDCWVDGIGYLGVYVPAGWTFDDWASNLFAYAYANEIRVPQIIRIRSY